MKQSKESILGVAVLVSGVFLVMAFFSNMGSASPEEKPKEEPTSEVSTVPSPSCGAVPSPS